MFTRERNNEKKIHQTFRLSDRSCRASRALHTDSPAWARVISECVHNSTPRRDTQVTRSARARMRRTLTRASSRDALSRHTVAHITSALSTTACASRGVAAHAATAPTIPPFDHTPLVRVRDTKTRGVVTTRRCAPDITCIRISTSHQQQQHQSALIISSRLFFLILNAPRSRTTARPPPRCIVSARRT